MLVQVTIENFLSFKEETTFSMIGIGSDKSHLDHLAIDAAGKGRSVLPISAIYGANGSGKSNFIAAVHFAKELIVKGTRSGKSIPVLTFKLGDRTKEPSKFEFIFTYEENLYSYGFKLNSSQILQEWLYATPKGKTREVKYFERITNEKQETTVEYGTRLKGKTEKQKNFLDFIIQGTPHNQLFLTEVIDRKVKDLQQFLQPVFKWFDDVLVLISAEATVKGIEIIVMSDKNFTNFLADFLKFTDTGINSVTTQEKEVKLENLPESIIDEIVERIGETEENSVLILEDSKGKQYRFTKGANGGVKSIQLKTQHQGENGKLIDFEIWEESDGTQRLINLVPAMFMLREDSEKVILLDELDRRLHTLLSRQFVESALRCRSYQNQLIFTTHDTNLLDLDLLRRDEIWFVEKDKYGSSHLYPLADFNVRPDLKIDKGYLNGRFGAIPFFADIHHLGWADCAGETSKV
jgi:hypothetical protein